MSIQPKWCELIAIGKKTVEVRKTKPKLETPFKVYIYCTKRETIYFPRDIFGNNALNGKVIGEFICDKITEFSFDEKYDNLTLMTMSWKSRLTKDEIADYANGQYIIYGWHISNLVIYDEPKELSEFKSASNYARKLRTEFFGKDPCCVSDYKITRPPQSWCYVERSDNNGE